MIGFSLAHSPQIGNVIHREIIYRSVRRRPDPDIDCAYRETRGRRVGNRVLILIIGDNGNLRPALVQ